MNPDFKRCLENQKIIPFKMGNELVKKEISVGEADLADAKAGFQEKRFKWSTIQAYYSMFQTARSLIYFKGYREKSHFCLSVALRALYVDEGKLDIQSVRDFISAMSLRESADYEAEFSEAGASAVITTAGRFIEKAKNLVGQEP